MARIAYDYDTGRPVLNSGNFRVALEDVFQFLTGSTITSDTVTEEGYKIIPLTRTKWVRVYGTSTDTKAVVIDLDLRNNTISYSSPYSLGVSNSLGSCAAVPIEGSSTEFIAYRKSVTQNSFTKYSVDGQVITSGTTSIWTGTGTTYFVERDADIIPLGNDKYLLIGMSTTTITWTGFPSVSMVFRFTDAGGFDFGEWEIVSTNRAYVSASKIPDRNDGSYAYNRMGNSTLRNVNIGNKVVSGLTSTGVDPTTFYINDVDSGKWASYDYQQSGSTPHYLVYVWGPDSKETYADDIVGDVSAPTFTIGTSETTTSGQTRAVWFTGYKPGQVIAAANVGTTERYYRKNVDFNGITTLDYIDSPMTYLQYVRHQNKGKYKDILALCYKKEVRFIQCNKATD